MHPHCHSRGPRAKLKAFFDSREINAFKKQLCDIGRRLWQKAYVGGNAGNLVIRVGSDLALCTPTLVSKGFMRPSQMCLVDPKGNQIAGKAKKTSEVLTHLEILNQQPRAVATCHCHPPYTTAFGIAGADLPAGLLSEFEVFVSVAIAPYRTPGTRQLAQSVGRLARNHNTIILANHGVISWSSTGIEDAYLKIEIIEGYCRMLMVAKQFGRPRNVIRPRQLEDLLKLKQHLGIPDPRHGLTAKDLAATAGWSVKRARRKRHTHQKPLSMVSQSPPIPRII